MATVDRSYAYLPGSTGLGEARRRVVFDCFMCGRKIVGKANTIHLGAQRHIDACRAKHPEWKEPICGDWNYC